MSGYATLYMVLKADMFLLSKYLYDQYKQSEVYERQLLLDLTGQGVTFTDLPDDYVDIGIKSIAYFVDVNIAGFEVILDKEKVGGSVREYVKSLEPLVFKYYPEFADSEESYKEIINTSYALKVVWHVR